ncbi:MAG: tyrosine-type recombinase/integrase [Gammaproteobacteria bacterium]|nr:tyrosine-type recombinase/integrase [Gammaproteobacteria bacterium]
MKTIKFYSCLSREIDRFVELRSLSGTDYSSQARLLMYFDRFLIEQYPNELTVTRHITDRYLQSISHLHPRTQGNRFCVVRQICKYIAQTDPCCYIPEPVKCITSSKIFHPYIFSKQEIINLLSAASTLQPRGSLRPHTYQTLFGLLYGSGIRISEAFSLTLKDFFPERKLLYIAEGKFRKARWVPLHRSTSHVLNQYVKRRLRADTRLPDSPLFINLRAKPLCHCTVYATFRQLLEKCGIPHRKHTGPRIHDLRHTFAVHRLLAWYQNKKDVNAMLPALATYMGHVCIGSTHVYLQPTTELLEQVNNRFHNHYLRNIKIRGGK